MDVSSVIRPPSTTQPRPWPSVSWQTAAKVAATTPTATTVVKSERPTPLRAAISEDLSDLVPLISDFSHWFAYSRAEATRRLKAGVQRRHDIGPPVPDPAMRCYRLPQPLGQNPPKCGHFGLGGQTWRRSARGRQKRAAKKCGRMSQRPA